MFLRELIFGRRSEFPELAEATRCDFLLFPGDVNASMFTKMGLKETVDITGDEAITHALDKPGGVIVFSVDINVLDREQSLAARINSVSVAQWQSIANRLFRYRKKATDQAYPTVAEISGLSVGRFFRGRYRSQRGLIFKETSLGVEVVGIETEMLLAFATALAKEFDQEIVLVKDYASNKIYLVDKHLTSMIDFFKIGYRLLTNYSNAKS